MKRILIIQTAFLGDVILATPLVSELNRLFPNSQIDFLVKKGNESLLANNPKLNSVYIFDKTNGKWKSLFGLIKQVRKSNYDLVINLHRFGSSGLIAGLSRGKKRYGFKKNPFSFLYTKSFDHVIGNGTHEVERNLSVIHEFGTSSKVRPELVPSKEDRHSISKLIKERYYCIAPASVWFTKQLPINKWTELIQTLPQQETIYLIGGKNDVERCETLVKKNPLHKIEILAGKLSLLKSAALMESATRNYVNDSGPLHLASSVNAPVTAFFCSTTPNFGFGPLSENSAIVEVENLDCRPCGLHGHKTCPKGHFECAEKMNVN
ncbi:MAG: glycosyltransferase family 9 protein [Crocinitomicaceae bacterium]|nr:glycosyltransferase family 9 protein [Crocinitomicaceae bacterium]MDG1777646.1 glycosyltransferase family 9 protein [Crocinitomicaceae bacterium]